MRWPLLLLEPAHRSPAPFFVHIHQAEALPEVRQNSSRELLSNWLNITRDFPLRTRTQFNNLFCY
jgi:hypothetical protein